MTRDAKTLRLMMPQWQGGNNGLSYPMGARLLAWLAPESDSPLVEVPVEPYEGGPPSLEKGVIELEALLKQNRAAKKIIEAFEPERLIIFGGDCLVSQAPFAYLNERYDGKLGILWLDAHPDVSTPEVFTHAHAMVLGNLLGEGHPVLAAEVRVKVEPERVLLAGLEETSAQEEEVIRRMGLSRVAAGQLADDSLPVLAWIENRKIEHLAIHLDLDVLNPRLFRSLLFANPEAREPIDAPSGRMTFGQLTRLMNDVSRRCEVVGFSLAEHMPWDAINLKNMLANISIMK